ncbi:hypothetical protein Q3G72_022451 [Acer saccharum]|nr:hypothetical protein Q3G72_022451 [Acer saccharum]
MKSPSSLCQWPSLFFSSRENLLFQQPPPAPPFHIEVTVTCFPLWSHSLSSRSSLLPLLSLHLKAPLAPVFKPQATTGGNDEEVPREMIKKEDKTEIVAKNDNNPWGWFLKLLTQLLKKFTTYDVDPKYQAYVAKAIAKGKTAGKTIEGGKIESEGRTEAKDKAKAKAKERLEAEEEKAQVEGSEKTMVEGSVYVFVFLFEGLLS